MKLRLILLLIIVFNFMGYGNVYSYGDKRTHTALTKEAIIKSYIENYLTDILGFYEGINHEHNSQKIIDMIMQGSTNEDLLFRAYNHFYDPLKGSPLENNGGLDDTFLGIPVKGIPNPYWAFTNDKPCDCLNPFNDNDCNEFTWKLARDKFYEALTATGKTEQDELFSQFYEKFGRVLHLLEDMGVPAHTRNDMEGHLDFTGYNSSINPISMIGNLYEDWVEDKQRKNESFISSILNDEDIEPYYATEPVLAAYPQNYWDNDKYTKSNTDPGQSIITSAGLAEYTNANFLSKYAMFGEFFDPEDKHYYPYPKTSSLEGYNENDFKPSIIWIEAEDGKFDQVLKNFNKISEGQTINNFVGFKYLADEIANKNNIVGVWTYKRTFLLDNNNHEAYARKLIPRTVWYTAGLINYFFRGRMDVNAVPLFEDVNGIQNQLYMLIVKIKNTTPNEAMKDGAFELHYKMENGQYGSALCGTVGCEGSCTQKVVSGTLIENGEKVIQFYMPTDNPITIDNFQTVKWTLVFKGTLGLEKDNAIVAKVFPLQDEITAGWGNKLFNEEWEAGNDKNGYPWNNWSHGACWFYPGGEGRHYYDQNTGSLDMRLVRLKNAYGEYPVGCSSVTRDLHLPISPNSWLQFKNYTGYLNYQKNSDGRDIQLQWLQLGFSNGWNIVFLDNATGDWPDGAYKPQTLYYVFNSGGIILNNIYSIFYANGIPITGTLYLEDIIFVQDMFELLHPQTEDLFMRLLSDYIRIIDTGPDFNFCQG